jgi:hypothetical protein
LFWVHPMELLGNVGRFGLLGERVNLGAR